MQCPRESGGDRPGRRKTSGRHPVRRKLDTADLAGVEALKSLKRKRPNVVKAQERKGPEAVARSATLTNLEEAKPRAALPGPAQNPAGGLQVGKAQEPRQMTFRRPL
jgi:hypothetical protein